MTNKNTWAGELLIEIEYPGSAGVASRHIKLQRVEPNPFASFNNSLLLTGIDTALNEERTFKLSKITSLKHDGQIINPTEFIEKYCGIKFEPRSRDAREKFPNGVMCITGTFSVSREKLEKYIESCGFDIQHSITVNTKYLALGEKLKGDKPTYSMSKVENAVKRGVKIIRESELMDLIDCDVADLV